MSSYLRGPLLSECAREVYAHIRRHEDVFEAWAHPCALYEELIRGSGSTSCILRAEPEVRAYHGWLRGRHRKLEVCAQRHELCCELHLGNAREAAL